MTEKLVIQKLTIAGKEYEYPDTTALVGKINELCDAVNKLETIAKNTNTVLKPILEERKSGIKVYEEAQDMYDNAILDALKDKQVDVVVEPADPYAEQRKCICKLCWFWNDDKTAKVIGILTGVFDEADRPFERNIDQTLYKHCEPVKPDDDIIYKGGNNE